MLESVASKGVDFIRRQHRAFKVNIARNLVSKFSIGLTQQYQSIYVSALGANAVELGLVSIAAPIIGGLLWASLGPEYVFYFLIATQVVKLGILWTIPSSVTRG